jgi:hypothetical protein
MTTYTKDQIEAGTLSARELLDSWTSGQGATGKEPAKYAHVKTGAINNITVNLDLMTAIAEMFVVKSRPTDKFYEALRAGYLSINHLDEYKEVKPVAKPLVGHYLTAAEYLQNCYDLLPVLPVPTFTDIQGVLATFKPSMNKTELVALIENVQTLCTLKEYTIADLTSEQNTKYIDLEMKEESLRIASNVLATYMEDIKPANDTTLQGKFYPERGTGALLNQLITEEGYKILVTTPVPAKLDASFNVVEPGYILFSIQVITV